jgi:CheY-like chemotaxis protein/anti-sigma regulatory factor (Ser/Thr protein kinase)
MAEHLAALINLTIDSVRAEAEGLVLRREPFRLRGLGETLAASLAARAEAKDLRSKAVIPRGLQDRVTGDAVRLRAAVENLIDNAVKFTDSGSVRLEMTAKPQSRGRIRVTFIVSDSGIGLKPAEIKRLFKPFAQANDSIVRRYGGAGLGLVFVRRVARAMGGDLKVTSNAGKGSRFVLTAIVDKTTASAEQSVGPGAPPNGANGAALKILCAEDNPYGRVVINAILSELGHRADFVGSSEAAVQAVSGGHYDLVLMDVILGETSGIEATRAIRALPGPPGRVPIIGISGHAAPGDEAKGRAAGLARATRARADHRYFRPRRAGRRGERPRCRHEWLCDEAGEPTHAGCDDRRRRGDIALRQLRLCEACGRGRSLHSARRRK